MNLTRIDYYTLLNVARDGSEDDIRRAFRKFARKYHPDRFRADRAKFAQATDIYTRGTEALNVLVDPAARRYYDAGIAKGRLRLSSEDIVQAHAALAPKRKEALVKSPQALAYVQQAKVAFKEGDLREAWMLLRQAEEIEPGNELIKRNIRAVTDKLRKGKRGF